MKLPIPEVLTTVFHRSQTVNLLEIPCEMAGISDPDLGHNLLNGQESVFQQLSCFLKPELAQHSRGRKMHVFGEEMS